MNRQRIASDSHAEDAAVAASAGWRAPLSEARLSAVCADAESTCAELAHFSECKFALVPSLSPRAKCPLHPVRPAVLQRKRYAP